MNRNMKKGILLTIALFTLPLLHANVMESIATDFEKGNAAGIAQHLNNNVELVIKDVDNVFTRQQAQTILTDFFRKNPPTSFTVTQKTRNEKQLFVIGTLNTQNDKYTIYFLIKNNLIQQLRIGISND